MRKSVSAEISGEPTVRMRSRDCELDFEADRTECVTDLLDIPVVCFPIQVVIVNTDGTPKTLAQGLRPLLRGPFSHFEQQCYSYFARHILRQPVNERHGQMPFENVLGSRETMDANAPCFGEA